MKMEKDINIGGQIKVSHADSRVSVHDVPKQAFNELKKIGIENKSGTTEWVVFGGVTFFASDKDEEK